MHGFYSLLLMVFISSSTHANEINFIDEEKNIKARMWELSETMKNGGSGASGYSQVLAPNYTRWTVGSEKINDKTNWMKGIQDWFDSGWRVTESNNNILEIDVVETHAFVRRVVSETYVGPNGENEIYQTGVAEIWVKNDDYWFLFRASVAPKKLN
jgi:hypothetical protein